MRVERVRKEGGRREEGGETHSKQSTARAVNHKLSQTRLQPHTSEI